MASRHANDDLARARAAFSGMTPAQMAELHGASGEGRQAILDDLNARVAAAGDTLTWLRAPPL